MAKFGKRLTIALPAATGRGTETLRRLARDHEALVRCIARERTLLDRRFHLVVPADVAAAPGRDGPGWPWRRGPRARRPSDLARARRTLSFRSGEVAHGLGSFGVSTRRLDADELAALWRATLGGVSGGTARRVALVDVLKLVHRHLVRRDPEDDAFVGVELRG